MRRLDEIERDAIPHHCKICNDALDLVALVRRLRDALQSIADEVAKAREAIDGVNGQPDEAEQLDATATAIQSAFDLARAALAAADGTDGARDTNKGDDR